MNRHLCERAVAAWAACGLRWLPAMEAWDPESHLWKFKEGHEPPDGIVRERYPDEPNYTDQWEDWLPNLDDLATLGCIEHGMLPAAWPEHEIEVHRHALCHEVFVRDRHGHCVWSSGTVPGLNLGESFVACLEAAARRVKR